MAVVIFHCSALLSGSALETRHANFGPLASAGVDLFFLISGYIIASSISRFDCGWSVSTTFLLKRLIRVWPPYMIATIIFCLALALKNPNVPSFADILRSLMFVQLDNTAPFYGFAALVVGWTLNYEMFFYAIVAVGLLMPHRWLFIVSAFATALVVVPLLLQPDLSLIQLVDAERVLANSWVFTNPLSWLFLIGAAVHFLEQRNLVVNNGVTLALSTAFSIAFLVACYLTPSMNKHGLTGMGLAVIPIFTIAVLSRALIEKFVPRTLVYLGDISFSLYLSHVITLSVMNAALSPIFDKGASLMLVTVLASVIGGAAYYSLVERPLTNLLTKLAGRRALRPANVVM